MKKAIDVNRILENPIIAAVSDIKSLEAAIHSPCDVIFLLECNIFNVADWVKEIQSAGKIVCLHVDLMKGIAHDAIGLEYIKEVIRADGIITTKASMIRKAKDLELITVQRVFVLDSKSIDMGIRTIKENKPDIVEIMPGVIPKVIRRMSGTVLAPIIAGGLINQKDEIIQLLDAGAMAVSTSCAELWYQ
jgi:glycerol uptake operon antiterminator